MAPTEVVYPTQNLPLDTITPPVSSVIAVAAKGETATTLQPTTPTIPSHTKQPNVNLADSLAALSQLSGASLAKLPSVISDREKLHITPDMAARILKLIEQKGNQFEEDHKAAAEATHNITTQEIEEIAQAIKQKPPDVENRVISQQRDNATVPHRETEQEKTSTPDKSGSTQKLPPPSRNTEQSKPSNSILSAADQSAQTPPPVAQNASRPEPASSPESQASSSQSSSSQLPGHLSFPHAQPGQSPQSPETNEFPAPESPGDQAKHPHQTLSQVTPPAVKHPTQGTRAPQTHAQTTKAQRTQMHTKPATRPTQQAKAISAKSNQPVPTQVPQPTQSNMAATVSPDIQAPGARVGGQPGRPGNPSVVVNKINAAGRPGGGQPVIDNVPQPAVPAQPFGSVEPAAPIQPAVGGTAVGGTAVGPAAGLSVGEKHLRLGPTRIPTTVIYRLIRTTLHTRTRPVIVHVHTTPIVKEEMDILQKYPQPKLPLRPRTTPLPIAATRLRTLGPGLNTQTHKNWVHSVQPTAPLATTMATGLAARPQLRPSIAAPHATVLPGIGGYNAVQRDKNHLKKVFQSKEENEKVAILSAASPTKVPHTDRPAVTVKRFVTFLYSSHLSGRGTYFYLSLLCRLFLT